MEELQPDLESQLGEAFTRATAVLTRHMQVADGIVVDVDTDPESDTAFTCDIQVGTGSDIVIYPDVPMKVLIGSRASVIEIPVKGTNCIISFRDGNMGRPQLDKVDQTDQLLLNCGQVIANEGQLGGLIKIEDLVNRLNILEKDVNTLKTAFNTWVTVPNDGGAALKAAAATWSGNPLTETVREDMEDTKFLH